MPEKSPTKALPTTIVVSEIGALRNVELIYYLPKWINLCQNVDLKFFIKFWEKYSPVLGQVDIQEIYSKLDKSKNLDVVNYLGNLLL